MSNTRTQPADKLPLRIQGSTAKIILTLYKQSMGLKDIPDDDPILKRCALLDAEACHAKNKLLPANNLYRAKEAITSNLYQLNEVVNTKKTIPGDRQEAAMLADLHAKYTDRFNSLKGNIEKVEQNSNQLLQEYRRLIQEQHENVSEFLLTKKDVSKADIERLLTQLEKDLKHFSVVVSQQEKEQKSLQQNLNELEKNAFNSIPASARKPVSEAPAAAARPERPEPE
ncbi:hypothetical protein [Aquicella lusitana]|uniref:Uncharacterized protein n=1 Tax=Aquicella lusitana TaxID=254246 RepID=A0A370GTE3_9COXI|nr:hypothetical protein [Aquicella lusitana]RDI46945.1 hypothetical protein C8D86_10468 [Aquicella lusitana]VVC73835.1 hypothetical protein AQULUS_15850 [Aquicella lusitana]